MAAISSSRAVATLRKRLLSLSPSLRRSLQTSVYDKNVEDQVCPVVVPDDMIAPLSDKYWAPNPRTGVFGPPTMTATGTTQETGFYSDPLDGLGSSEAAAALEQKVFFRPVEDLDLPELR